MAGVRLLLGESNRAQAVPSADAAQFMKTVVSAYPLDVQMTSMMDVSVNLIAQPGECVRAWRHQVGQCAAR